MSMASSVCLGRPMPAMEEIQPSKGDFASLKLQERLDHQITLTMKKRRSLSDAAQSSESSAISQGGVASSSSSSQVVSDGKGNKKVVGKSEAVAEGGSSSKTQTSTLGYVSLKQDLDGSVEYVVNSASSASAQESSDLEPQDATEETPNAKAEVSGESIISENKPDATATHQASAAGTLTASEGINKVIISQNKPTMVD